MKTIQIQKNSFKSIELASNYKYKYKLFNELLECLKPKCIGTTKEKLKDVKCLLKYLSQPGKDFYKKFFQELFVKGVKKRWLR